MAYLPSQPSPISPSSASQDFYIAFRQRLRSVPRLVPSPSRCTSSGRTEFVFCEPNFLLLTGVVGWINIRDCERPLTMYLDHRGAAGPSVMVHFPWGFSVTSCR